MSEFDVPTASTRRRRSRWLTLWWLALIIIALTLLAALIFSLSSSLGKQVTNIIPTAIDSYGQNVIQLTRCAEPANNCGQYDIHQRATHTSLPPSTLTPVGTPVSEASTPLTNEANTAPNSPLPTVTNTPITPMPALEANAEATLDAIFPQQPIPPAPAGLNPGDQSFMDRAVDNTLGTNSFHYDADANLLIAMPNEQGSVRLQIAGVVQNWQELGAPDFAFSGRFTLSSNLEGMQTGTIEVRIIGDTLYIEMPTEDGQFIWIEMAFSDLSTVGLSGEGINDLYEDMNMNLDQLDQIPQILDIFAFGNFVNTERLGNVGDMAQFHTDFDLHGFLKSELLDSLVFSLAGLSGIDTSDETVAQELYLETRQFQATVDQMIPELNLAIDRYATLTTELISQIIIDFDSSLTGFQANNEIIQIEIDGDIALNLSGYDQGLTVEVPANAVPITAEQIQQLTAQMQITAPQP